jgi:predicted ester cyclase
MSLEQNKAIARRHFDELWTKGDLDAADQIYSTDAVGHCGTNPDQTDYPASEKAIVRRDRAEFPDGVATVEDQIAEGNVVVTRWRFQGTNTGSVEGNPPTGRGVTVTGFHLHRIVNGNIVEIWAQPDVFGFMSQLGLLPTAPTPAG